MFKIELNLSYSSMEINFSAISHVENANSIVEQGIAIF